MVAKLLNHSFQINACLYIAKIVRVAKPYNNDKLTWASLYIAKIVRVAKLFDLLPLV